MFSIRVKRRLHNHENETIGEMWGEQGRRSTLAPGLSRKMLHHHRLTLSTGRSEKNHRQHMATNPIMVTDRNVTLHGKFSFLVYCRRTTRSQIHYIQFVCGGTAPHPYLTFFATTPPSRLILVSD